MPRIISNNDFYDLELEQLFLIQLLHHPQRSSLIEQSFVAMFFSTNDQLHRRYFQLIKSIYFDKSIPNARHGDLLNEFSLAAEAFEKFKISKEFTYHYLGNDSPQMSRAKDIIPEQSIRKLKDLLFRRLAVVRLNRAAHILDDGKASEDETESSIEEELRKLLFTRQKLLGNIKANSDVLARIVAERVNSTTDTVFTPFNFLNRRIYGVLRRTISSLIAKPKHQKSTFIDNFLAGAVEKFDYCGAIISLEDPKEERVKRIVAPRLGISLTDLRFKRIKLSEDDVRRVLKISLHDKLHIVDTRDVSTPEEVVGFLNDVKPDLAGIDHLQKLQVKDLVRDLIAAVNMFEVAASRNDGHYIITAQVTDKKIFGRQEQNPQASDVQWTSVLRQSSTEMYGLYWQYQDTKNRFQMNQIELEILASRYADAIGKITIAIKPDQAQFLEEIIL